MEVTNMALAQKAALKHLGYDSMDDAHYWAKDNHDLNRLDALTAVIDEAISDALTTAHAETAALRAEVERLRGVLTALAAYDDDHANEYLAKFSSYAGFDEPYAVKAARQALKVQP